MTSYSHTAEPQHRPSLPGICDKRLGNKQELGEDLGRHQGYAKPGPLHKHEPHEGRS